MVTGANGNLGIAVTHHFLKAGYRVLATVRNQASASELPPHEHLKVETVDLASEEEALNWVTRNSSEYGPVHAALLLVGGFTSGDLESTGSAVIRQQIQLNFETAYHVARPVFQQMLKQDQGRIILIGARPALEPSAGKNLIAYGLSKSLLFKLSEYLNATAKGRNVSATVVTVSTLDTETNRRAMPAADPSKWVKPEALAGILEFIVSPQGDPLRETVLKVYNNS